ncbi:hypothetical protein NDU88_005597 [Pleurodeles waltl]|uniref:Uncharacterized protein n=1 Tax=Pleurodeles waltl TaxID=8319 RepID=A0AAV7WZ40_PLEWA|nr:hypothetical protein NDU88_005597 [Pleurodeles waltl]
MWSASAVGALKDAADPETPLFPTGSRVYSGGKGGRTPISMINIKEGLTVSCKQSTESLLNNRNFIFLWSHRAP